MAGASSITTIMQQNPLKLEDEMLITLDSWPEISTDGKVNTKGFLRCSNLVVKFIESLGVAFSPVSRDVHGNIKKIMAKYVENPERYKFLEDIVTEEMLLPTRIVTDALLWLKRFEYGDIGLNFLCTLLESLVSDYENGIETESIISNLRSSYEATLAMYHGFILKQLFVFLCQAAPYRRELFQRLSIIVNEQDRAVFMLQLKTFHQGLRSNLNVLFAFYSAKKLIPP